MLRLGKLANYGLLITTHLAKNTQGTTATTEEISTALSIPMATMRKLMKLLVDAKIVVSQREVTAGYQLANDPNQINITQMIQAVSGSINITECCEKSFQYAKACCL